MNLDFENYPKIQMGYLMIPSPSDDLKRYPEVYDRFCGIIYMAAKVGGDSDKYFISKKAKDAVHIRSALSEFVGVEEYVMQTYPNAVPEAYRLYKSSNPIFHMLKLLRNFNIHLSDSVLDFKPMMVRTLIENSGEFEINVDFISNLSVDELKRLKSAKDYSAELLYEMVRCFEKEQHEFGISTLIISSALDYSEIILKAIENNVE
ncbi:hypothetical protein [Acinetobacter towneri]|uniref:Uncharacterized protein n=1 Tax=Acinetobacter towneri TaxID=202956 RepID=A0AAP9GUL7_9GAMM|nr:hypothetical protein [Acinetobacter towneri]QGM26914.1 hypothetical protein GJD93_04045 [Acinetobacter towneri]UNT61388.1 hypothetical protein IHE36_10740 [Acinetobacter towneri]